MMIESLIAMMRFLGARKDDDVADRMNYLFTPNILLALSVLISFKQFGGRPLECMFPNKFPSSWEQYAENLCWSEDTYFVSSDVHVAQISENQRYAEDRRLSYYQWVPFFLLLQAACFRFPSFLWKCLSLGSGIRVHDIVVKAMDPGNMDENQRRNNVDFLAAHMGRALRFQHRMQHRNIIVHKTMKLLNITYSACFISYMYIVTKIFYLTNVLVQLFLETDKYSWYGFAVIRDLINGVPWERSGYFPRVRQVANIQKYSVQCVLVINIFTEKIFILLWFWYMTLLFVTIASLIYWIVVLSFPCFGRWFVAQSLELNEDQNFDINKINQFVNEYLKQDGVFLLRMISHHAGVMILTDLLMKLYKIYYSYSGENGILHSYPLNSTQLTNSKTNHTGNARERKNVKSKNKNVDKNRDVICHLLPASPTYDKNVELGSDESDDGNQTMQVDDDDDDIQLNTKSPISNRSPRSDRSKRI